MIRFTKQQLIQTVLSESKDIQDYLNAGGLPANERSSMDNEFYAEYVKPVYDMLEWYVENVTTLPIEQVLTWSFDQDLTRDQMAWLEHYRGQLSLEKVKLNLAQKLGTTHLNTKLYQMMKERHMNSTDSTRKFALELFKLSLPNI